MNSIFQEFLNELHDSENFKNLYLSLRNNYIYNFLGVEIDKYQFEYVEIKKLIEYSSLFALSSDFFHIEISQKINSFLLNLYPGDKNIIFGIQMIYVRVGNFPVIKQEMFENNYLTEDGEYSFDKELLSEFIFERNNSQILIGEKESFINKFQKEVLDSLTENDILSVSAPTSFGKSFIVRTYITQIFSQSNNNSVLIIVPSKALIEDFLNDLLSIKREYGLTYNIITHFIPEDSNLDNKIFILTQERLLATLRKNPSTLEKITLFYCDEAHKISYTGRGFILRRVIEEFIKYNTDCKKIFTSPIIKNPDYFVNKFFAGTELRSAFKLVEYKPVEKNIFLYTLSSSGKKFDIFTYENLKGKYKKELLVKNTSFSAIISGKNPEYENDINLYKIDIVTKSSFEGNTVIYISSKTKLIAYAKHMLNSVTPNKIPSKQDLDDIKEYIEENFYNGLYLLDFLKKGIGVHAGFLPVGLRNKVVDLFKKGNLSYILCTSTLLEGVNLPIKNIVLLNTNSGAGNSKLGKTDFLNLIGRAGRYKYELSGNVILFNDTDSIDIFNDYLNIKDGELEIKDVEENILNNTTKKRELFKIFQDRNFDSIYKKNDRDSYEYIFYSLFMNGDEINKLNLKDEEKALILEVISSFKSDTFFSKRIFDENIGISPISQKELYDTLSKIDAKDLLEFFELIKDRFKLRGEFSKVLEMIQKVFKVRKLFHNEVFNSKREFQKILNWISGKSLNEIINIEIASYKKGIYLNQDKRVPLEKEVDEKVLDELTYYTNTIGFSWVKYIRVFYNILRHVCIEKNIHIDNEDYEKTVDAFLFTLETGIDSGLGKYLYSIGLPRSISVKVNKLLWIIIKDVKDFDIEYIKWLFNRNRVRTFLKLRLSKLAYEELYNNLDI